MTGFPAFWSLLSLVLTYILCIGMVDTNPEESACTYPCRCNDTAVDCSYDRLRVIPPNLPLYMSELYLAGNYISVIQNNSFTGMSSLYRLVLSKNAIRSVDSDAFSNLTALRWLDLSNNDIGQLDSRHFSGLRNLKDLRIGWNPLLNVSADAFQDLTSITEIHAEGNLFSDLYDFSGLENLELLNLAECRVRMFRAENFRRLPRLRFLSLSMNELESLPVDILRDMGSLERLILGSNLIRSLQRYDFQVNANLTNIDLSNNEIDSLDGVQIGQLRQLKLVDFSENAIVALPEMLLVGVAADSSLVLKLNWNPLVCDCRMKTIFHLLARATRVLVKGECKEPEILDSHEVARVDPTLLMCPPTQLEGHPQSVVATLSDPVILTCPVQGDPIPDVTWLYHNQSTASNIRVSESFLRTNPVNGTQEVVYEEATFDQSGLYICIATNKLGSVEVSLALTVAPRNMLSFKSVSCPSNKSFIFLAVLFIVIFAAVVVTFVIYRKYVTAMRTQRNMNYASLRDNEGEAI